MISAELLSDVESCQRRGYYSRDFLPRRLHPTELTRQALYRALCSPEPDPGKAAGDGVMELCANVGLDLKETGHLYDVGLHHAAIADLVATWGRNRISGPLGVPADLGVGNHVWESSCLCQPAEGRLVRVVLVDHFSDERTLSESRSWFTIGEVAVYDAPMDVYLVSLGASRGGKRHSAWSKALLHPRNRQVRFKKQGWNKETRGMTEGFRETWIPVWREEHQEISRENWLRAMEMDGVLQELTTSFTVEPLNPFRRMEALETIQRKADLLAQLEKLPDPSFSQCDWPRPCPFRCICFAPARVTPEQLAFRHRLQS
jgi:hypothetical protein